LSWAARLKQKSGEAEIHAVYEACGFGFALQRQLAKLGITGHVVCPIAVEIGSESIALALRRGGRRIAIDDGADFQPLASHGCGIGEYDNDEEESTSHTPNEIEVSYGH
jgi:hypothetical protein